MKKKSRILIYPLAIIGMFVILTNSCKKDVSDPFGILSNYNPYSSGSHWEYISSGGSTLSRDATGNTIDKYGKKYYEIKSTSSTNAIYFYICKKDEIYYELFLEDQSFYEFEFITMKDNLKVNDTWSKVSKLKSGDETHMVTVKEVNTSITVQGKTYKNVVHVKDEYSGNYTDIYYADGIGWIKAEYSSGGYTELKSYTIK